MLKIFIDDIRAEVLTILSDLGCEVTSILEIVITLVAGIIVSLSPLLAPVVAIIAPLGPLPQGLINTRPELIPVFIPSHDKATNMHCQDITNVAMLSYNLVFSVNITGSTFSPRSLISVFHF